MALTGIHVECGVAEKRTDNSVLFSRIWSETVAYGTPTTQAAPSSYPAGSLVFRIRNSSAGEAWVSTASTPDTSAAASSTDNNARAHFAASELRDLPAKAGWKVLANAVS